MDNPTNLNLIGISGKIGSGKDTIASIIQYHMACQKWGYNESDPFRNDSTRNYEGGGWYNKKFTTKPVEAYKIITGTDYHSLTRDEKEKVRPDFINFAQGLKAIMGDGVWVDGLFVDFEKPKHVWKFHESTEEIIPKWVISDVRLKIEAEAVLSRGGLLIRTDRLTTRPLDNVTETELDIYEGFHVRMPNNGNSIPDLVTEVGLILKHFKYIK